jgi:hypothetical protein
MRKKGEREVSERGQGKERKKGDRRERNERKMSERGLQNKE